MRLCRDVENAGSLQLAFSAGCAADAIAKFDEHQPDVLLVDIRLPDGDGTQVIAYARAKRTTTNVLVISALGDESSVIRAIKSGAMGYLLKDDSGEMIEASILQLVNGGSPISPPIARHLIQHFQPQTDGDSDVGASADTLSPRELDVLRLAAKGYTYQEVAQLLGISANTVGSYTKKIYEKLAVNSRTEALFEATRLGLVSPPIRQ